MAPPQASRSAGRSNLLPPPSTWSSTSLPRPSLSLATKSLKPQSFGHAASRNSPGDMISPTYTSASPLSPSSNLSKPSNVKLHRRAGSGSSLPGATMSAAHAASHFTSPSATGDDLYPNVSTSLHATQNATPRIKQYRRNMSSSKEDQGYLDLSKSYSENERLAGLGIQDFGAPTRSAADVHVRKQPHVRTTSVGSQMSTGSGAMRPGQSFTHPMKQVPRPYTPPTLASYASSLDHAADESEDVVDDDFRPGPGFRSRRSVSISSMQPTPLSKSHMASDFALASEFPNTSTSNLSIKSSHSTKSTKPARGGLPRRDTERSTDLASHSPSSRTSFDKAFGFVARRATDAEPQSRDELIRAARRKFEEKEAHKDRRQERDALKRRDTEEARSGRRQERQRRPSDAASSGEQRPWRTPALRQGTGGDSAASPKQQQMLKKGEKKRRPPSSSSAGAAAPGASPPGLDEKVPARDYEHFRPTHAAALPRPGKEAGTGVRAPREPVFEHTVRHPRRTESGGWLRFSTWFQTRLLSCGKA